MKQKRKTRILQRLANHLRTFHPESMDEFLCPTCLRTVPISTPSRISEAHIVPRVSGGRLRTYLCRSCNSQFGTRQDKWLGEYARLRRSRQDILETQLKPNHFDIDGVRVGGTFIADRQAGIKFLVHIDRTAPTALQELDHRMKTTGQLGSKITIPIPLMANRGLVDVGFLTAAYLLWFHEMGYSWALQAHLDQVREQIRSPDQLIIGHKYTVALRDWYFETPWVGVVRHRDELILVAGIADRLVSLPAADKPNQRFDELGQLKEMTTARYRHMGFYSRHEFGGPVGLIVEDRMLVIPDVLLRASRPGRFIFYSSMEGDPAWMSRVSGQEAVALQARHDVQVVEAKYQPHVPRSETGRAKNTDE